MQSPETILYLSKELYNKEPEAFVLAISGNQWGLGTCLSQKAENNLQKAFLFFQQILDTEFRKTAWNAGKPYLLQDTVTHQNWIERVKVTCFKTVWTY